jgi:hypothetical protein
MKTPAEPKTHCQKLAVLKCERVKVSKYKKLHGSSCPLSRTPSSTLEGWQQPLKEFITCIWYVTLLHLVSTPNIMSHHV